MTIGKKSMPQTFQTKNKIETLEEIRLAVLSTLAFYSLYDCPIQLEQIHKLLYRQKSGFEEVKQILNRLILEKKVFTDGEYYALKPWNPIRVLVNKEETEKRWQKIRKFSKILANLPFVSQIAVINSLAIGNADAESDIDFFVIVKPKRLYFVRSSIILLFKALGVYKTRTKINQQFCFGFYVDEAQLQLKNLQLKEEDPYFAFWFATLIPLFNTKAYAKLVESNAWIRDYFPNWNDYYKEGDLFMQSVGVFKKFLEALFYFPAIITEPLLRWIHIRHTFRLPENHWATSTTIAKKDILKLHALDPREQIKNNFYMVLKGLK